MLANQTLFESDLWSKSGFCTDLSAAEGGEFCNLFVGLKIYAGNINYYQHFKHNYKLSMI